MMFYLFYFVFLGGGPSAGAALLSWIKNGSTLQHNKLIVSDWIPVWAVLSFWCYFLMFVARTSNVFSGLRASSVCDVMWICSLIHNPWLCEYMLLHWGPSTQHGNQFCEGYDIVFVLYCWMLQDNSITVHCLAILVNTSKFFLVTSMTCQSINDNVFPCSNAKIKI